MLEDSYVATALVTALSVQVTDSQYKEKNLILAG